MSHEQPGRSLPQEAGATTDPLTAPARAATEPVTCSMKHFLESVPPSGQMTKIDDLTFRRPQSVGLHLTIPELNLHCAECNGIRYFDCGQTLIPDSGKYRELFLTYNCRNCQKQQKTYALRVYAFAGSSNGMALKFGERPHFGIPTPAKVVKLLAAEKDYFEKGRRSEGQGLGIAAFAYYRRVVENRKNEIIGKIMEVAVKLGGSDELVVELEAARRERQFSKAIESIKHGLPQMLLIDGHNPLSLLHDALSEGLHAETDEDCLELARSIRAVLFELVDRLSMAMTDDAQLKSAVNTLLQRKQAKASPAA
jgi:hypothetical protein